MFTTKKRLRDLELQRKRDIERNDPSYLLTLYSENPDLWKRMAAAAMGVSMIAIERTYNGEKVRHLSHYGDVMRALALGLKEIRNV